MSFVRTVTIWCDAPGCGRGFRIPYREGHSLSQTRTAAVADGWLYEPGVSNVNFMTPPMDFCPKHAKEYENGRW